jgi:hypothetical protein
VSSRSIAATSFAPASTVRFARPTSVVSPIIVRGDSSAPSSAFSGGDGEEKRPKKKHVAPTAVAEARAKTVEGEDPLSSA